MAIPGFRRLRLVPAVLALALTAAACGGDGGGDGGGGDSGSGPIKLGLVAPKTGPLADFGAQVEKGAQVAVDLINADGGVDGRDLEILWEDDQSSPDGMTAAIRKF